MSRIGLKVIEVPEKVTVTKNGDDITVKGPKGELTRYFDPRITFEQKDGEIHFSRSSEADKALHGTERANLASMIEGVTDGYVKKLTLVGVGYRAVAQGKKLTLNVGYSHPVVFEAPEGITVKTPSELQLKLKVFQNKLLVNLRQKFVMFVHQNLIRVKVFVTKMNMYVARKVRLVNNK